MEDPSKPKLKLDCAPICHKNFPSKIRIINIPMDQKIRKFNCARTTTNNGYIHICHKLTIRTSFIFITMIFITFGIIAYGVVNQGNYSDLLLTQMNDELSSKEHQYENNNFQDLIDISQPAKKIESSVSDYLNYRLRRDIINVPTGVNGISRKTYMKRSIERINKQNACNRRYKYCQEILASMQNNVNTVKDAIHNIDTSLNRPAYTELFGNLMQCLECEDIVQTDATQYYQRPNSPNHNHILHTYTHDKLNNAPPGQNKPIERENLMAGPNGSKLMAGTKLTELIRNTTAIKKTSNLHPINDDAPIQNILYDHYFPLPNSNRNDILTGPDSSFHSNTRDNIATIDGMNYAETSNNETKLYTQFPDGKSSQENHINAKILSGSPFYQPGSIFELPPPILPTAETMKTGQQLQLTPSMSVLPYPVCFYGTPPVIHPATSIYEQHSQSSPFGIHPGSSNPSEITSGNFAAGQGQGFIPFQHSGYQSPPIQSFGNSPYLPQGSPSPHGINDQKTGPTGYPGPLYCTFMSTFHFPTVPGDYQRSSGPADDIHDRQNFDSLYNDQNGWRANPDNNNVHYNIVANSQDNTSTCMPNYHPCLDKSLCVLRSQWCDGKVDCSDASDETRCSCKDRINKDRFCDGYFDCPHGEDEMGCFGCASNTFSCEDWTKFNQQGNCLKLSQRCDGIAQCRNKKDEKDCSALIDSQYIDDEDMFTVGYTAGYLFKNYYGKWYPACTPTKVWAVESCTAESGTPIISQPLQILFGPASDENTKNNRIYISKLPSGRNVLVRDCENNGIFVNCPPITCGTRVNSNNDRYRSRFEDILVAASHTNFTGDQSNNNNNKTEESNENEELTNILLEEEQLSVDGRIVGGRASQPKAWPSIVAIYKDGFYKCGGVILNEYWILTAAHCLEKYFTHYYRIHAGLLRRFSFSPMEQTRRAEFIIIHPQYNAALKVNDLGLMKLNEPLRFNRWIRPICLPDNLLINKPNPGEMCTTIGWGSTVESGPEPDHLREVEVQIYPSCKLPSDKTEAVICAGKPQGGKDACQGDSGGPMMCRVLGANDQWYIGGIVSHGVGCGRPDEPGAYTNVIHFTPWINETIYDSQALVGPKPLENCPGFSCENGLGKCLPNHRRCDKIVDCMDAEDEINCQHNTYMTQPSFRTIDDSVPDLYDVDANSKNGPIPESVEVWTKKSIIEVGHQPIPMNEFPLSDPPSTTMEATNVFELTDYLTTTIEPSSTIDDLVMSNSDFPKEMSHFTCTRLVQSISMAARCDKVVDCEDGTDEVNCTCKDILRNQYPAAICNGRVDCYDFTDEDDCAFCGENEYICLRSGTCIPLSKKCDNYVDCPLAEDELDCFALITEPMLDADKRPATDVPNVGIVAKDVNGTWKTYCSNDPNENNTQRIVNEICQYLGFKGMLMSYFGPKLNLTSLNRQIDEGDDEFVVSVSDSTLEFSIQNETNECNPIMTKCRKTLISPSKSYLYKHTSDENSAYMWPWQGAIHIEGKYHCPAIFLHGRWFLTSSRCTENIDLNINATTLIAGMSPAYKHVPGPYEMTRNVIMIKLINDFNVSLLNVDSYPESRYVQPIFPENRFSAATAQDECFAIGTDSKFNSTTTSFQSIPENCPSCDRCFKRDIHHDECKNTTNGDWSGIVICRGPSGWYPAAAFSGKDIKCGFQTAQSLTSIDQMFPYLTDAMDDENLLPSELPNCDGIRCERGKCIPWNKVCDSIQDCMKGEDELMSYCKEKRNLCRNSTIVKCECSKSELKCRNGDCVPKETFCDGKNDCLDGSDEPSDCNCGEYLKLTEPELVCDNIRHCYDKTDENKCHCTDSSFKCDNNKDAECIPYDFVCDHDKDCTNGQDEAFCRMIKNNPKSAEFAGEILRRSYGIWHTECFPTPVRNDSQALQICESFGHSNGTIMTIEKAAPYTTAVQLQLDNFFMIRLSDKWAITTRKAKPLATLVRATDDCHRAFIKYQSRYIRNQHELVIWECERLIPPTQSCEWILREERKRKKDRYKPLQQFAFDGSDLIQPAFLWLPRLYNDPGPPRFVPAYP